MIVDAMVIQDLKKRKKYAFNIIYKQYYKLVYYIALDIVKDETVAQDILQDTFIKLMNDIENYVDNGNFKQYIATIAKNCALNAYRKRKNNKETLSIPDNASYEEDNSLFMVSITLNHLLDKEEAKIVYKKVILDYSFQEIADEMKESIGLVQGKYYKALKILRKHYEEEKR